ncbi:MAG: rhodanese-like domain-containing protein [Oceanidesulfovibrio sp.]
MVRFENSNDGRGRLLAAAPLIVFVLAAALALAYFRPFSPAVPEGTPGQVLEIVPPSEAAGIIDSTPNLAILDLRSPADHARGRIPGARLMDYNDEAFRLQLDSLDRSIPYLLYCADQQDRCAQAMKRMAGHDFATVRLLQGGFHAWRNAGLPVAR